MSCKVDGTTIVLTRGDTMSLKVNILKDGETYTNSIKLKIEPKGSFYMPGGTSKR